MAPVRSSVPYKFKRNIASAVNLAESNCVFKTREAISEETKNLRWKADYLPQQCTQKTLSQSGRRPNWFYITYFVLGRISGRSWTVSTSAYDWLQRRQLIMLKQVIEMKHPAVSNREGVVVHYNNCRRHTFLMTRQTLTGFDWSIGRIAGILPR